jgi:hypothetical protein
MIDCFVPFAFRNNYKGYSLESRLHFRLHAALSQIKSANGEGDAANDSPVMEDGQSPDDTVDQHQNNATK